MFAHADSRPMPIWSYEHKVMANGWLSYSACILLYWSLSKRCLQERVTFPFWSTLAWVSKSALVFVTDSGWSLAEYTVLDDTLVWPRWNAIY